MLHVKYDSLFILYSFFNLCFIPANKLTALLLSVYRLRARKWRKKLCFASFLCQWLLLGFSWLLRMELQSQEKRYRLNWFSFVFKCLLLLPLIIFYDYRVSPRDNPIVIQYSVLINVYVLCMGISRLLQGLCLSSCRLKRLKRLERQVKVIKI